MSPMPVRALSPQSSVLSPQSLVLIPRPSVLPPKEHRGLASSRMLRVCFFIAVLLSLLLALTTRIEAGFLMLSGTHRVTGRGP